MGIRDLFYNVLNSKNKTDVPDEDYERRLKAAERSGTNIEGQILRLQMIKTRLSEDKEDTGPDINDLDAWDKKWVSIGRLSTANLAPFNNKVGLYKHVIGGQVMYIGRATEWNNGGLRKKLGDYRSDNDGVRTHTSDRKIRKHLEDIVTFVLVLGEDEEAAEKAKYLEKQFIGYYLPEWNYYFR